MFSKQEIVMKGEPPYNGHLLVRLGGSLFIYRECEQFLGSHTYKMIDNPINQATLSLILHGLNNNTHPAEIIQRRLREIKCNDDFVFTHPIFDKLKGKR